MEDEILVYSTSPTSSTGGDVSEMVDSLSKEGLM
jgi:hypothetical protein